MSKTTKSGAFTFPDQEHVSYGRPFSRVVPEEMARIGVSRAVILTTPPLAGPGSITEELSLSLGRRCVAVYADCQAHTPIDTVLAAAAIARRERADIIIALGGSSVIDTAKAAQFFLWEDLSDNAGFDKFANRGFAGSQDDPVAIRILAVPTTFSGSEFTPFASILDKRKGKVLFRHRKIIPRITILDPAALTGTPLPLLLSTGFKAIDHAVETICSPGATAVSDAPAIGALTLLFKALRLINQDKSNLKALLDGQLGVWLSLAGLAGGVAYGASHALGYVLGAAHDVPHGYTSCVTLPPVVRWNRPSCTAQQEMAAKALGSTHGNLELLLEELLAELELPARLGALGIKREDLPSIAKQAFVHPFMATNPRPVQSADEILSLLETNL